MRTLRLLLAAMLLWTSAAQAASAPAPEMTNSELQGVSCLGTGTLSATTTTILVILSPLEALTLPVIVAAFAAGCGVGAIAAPGVNYLGRWAGFWRKEPTPAIVQASR